MILTLTSLFILFSYILFCVKKFGVPPSLSETYYLLDKNWLFTSVLAVSDILLLIGWLNISDSFLAFLCAVCILFVAVAPMFKGIQKNIHTISAILGGLFGIIFCFISCWIIPVIFILIAAVLTIKTRKPIFWFEMAAFASVYSTVIYLYV